MEYDFEVPWNTCLGDVSQMWSPNSQKILCILSPIRIMKKWSTKRTRKLDASRYLNDCHVNFSVCSGYISWSRGDADR